MILNRIPSLIIPQYKGFINPTKFRALIPIQCKLKSNKLIIRSIFNSNTSILINIRTNTKPKMRYMVPIQPFHTTTINKIGPLSTTLVNIINFSCRLSLLCIPFFFIFKYFKKYPKFTFIFICFPLTLFGIMALLSVEYSEYGQRYRLVFVDELSEIEEIKRNFKIYKNDLNLNYDLITDELLAMIRIIINKLLNVTGEFDKRDILKQNWEILIIDSDKLQAQVLSSGHIVIHTGVLKFIHSIDELAFILAHEIAHVLFRHNAELRSLTDLTNNFLFVVAGIVDVVSNYFPKVKQWLGPTLSNCSKGSLLYPYSRKQEFEADKAGAFLMARANYNPTCSIDMWKRMEEYFKDKNINTSQQNSIKQDQQIDKIYDINKGQNRHNFESHPDAIKRAEYLESLIKIVMPIYNQAKLEAKSTNSFAFKCWQPLYKEASWKEC